MVHLLCLLVAAGALVLAGACDDYSSSWDNPVTYSVSCDDVSCPGASDRSTYTSGGDSAITCTWNCADYGDQYLRYVSLDFWSWDGACYELESEYVADGICNY